ncbi:alpha/beta hydrolase [Streptomyces sp. NPDC058676]|uniref:alpha/beta hydrolase n=1 Tax=unclassified Streptomyces TaxID=2593676 RepID=UPI00364C4F84
MQPRLVFVHGIGGPRQPATELDAWLRALGAGASLSGHSRHVPDLVGGRVADSRFAYYGDLFGLGQAQSAGGALEEHEAVFVRELLLEAIDERRARATRDEELRMLHHAQAQLTPHGSAQGLGSVARQVLGAANSLLSLPGVRTFGGWAGASLMVGQLRQVARYLARAEPDDSGTTLDSRIRRRVAGQLDPAGPTIVVAHSLGTVVALEALQSYEGSVPLLVTLGSPMGLRGAVRDRMRPHPLRVPESVEVWLNFWDRDDLVVGLPRLEKAVRPNARSVLPDTRRIDSDGAWVHPAIQYLGQPGVAGPVLEALTANRAAPRT